MTPPEPSIASSRLVESKLVSRVKSICGPPSTEPLSWRRGCCGINSPRENIWASFDFQILQRRRRQLRSAPSVQFPSQSIVSSFARSIARLTFGVSFPVFARLCAAATNLSASMVSGQRLCSRLDQGFHLSSCCSSRSAFYWPWWRR